MSLENKLYQETKQYIAEEIAKAEKIEKKLLESQINADIFTLSGWHEMMLENNAKRLQHLSLLNTMLDAEYEKLKEESLLQEALALSEAAGIDLGQLSEAETNRIIKEAMNIIAAEKTTSY
jgi:hypothetical protein